MATKAELVALLRTYARKYGIDEGIAIAQIQQESSFNPRAGSSAGAKGIAQFMPATARRFNVSVYDVNSSFDGWGRYMRFLLNRYNGRYDLALAGYNAGEGNVDKYNGIPPFTETRNYVATILRNASATVSATVTTTGNVNPIIPNAGSLESLFSSFNEVDLSAGTGINTGALLLIGAGLLTIYLIAR